MTLSKAEQERGRIEGPLRYTDAVPWFVYIARARTGRLHVGITTNPEERLAEHNTGEGSRFAQQQGPFTLAYVSPPFADKPSARKREAQMKRWTHVKKEKLISGEWK